MKHFHLWLSAFGLFLLSTAALAGQARMPNPEIDENDKVKYIDSLCAQGTFVGVKYLDCEKHDEACIVTSLCRSAGVIMPAYDSEMARSSEPAIEVVCPDDQMPIGIAYTDGMPYYDWMDGITVICPKVGDVLDEELVHDDIAGGREPVKIRAEGRTIIGVSCKRIKKKGMGPIDGCTIMVTY